MVTTTWVQEAGQSSLTETGTVQTFAAAAEAYKLAAEAAAAQAAADLVLTDADTVATAADRVQTGLDVTVTAADRVQTGLDAIATAADVVSIAGSEAATAADRVQTGLDAAATAADLLLTDADTIATAADRVQTGLDVVATAADRVQTGLDAAATAADRVQTGLDAAATAADVVSIAGSEAATAADRVQTGLDAVATAADRVQTGLDVIATAADRVQTGLDVTAAAASASSASASADAALTALDNFDDRYLGQKASAPTLDNDGNPLAIGALYFDTTDAAMKVYDGANWLAAYASLAGALLAINNLSDLSSTSAARTSLGLDIGVNVQAYDANIVSDGAYVHTDNNYTTAEKSKLAGVEAGATADQAASEILTAIKTVDGAASGLDADLLDGLHASSFLQANQTITLSGDATGSGTTSIVVTVADDSHNHIISNVDGLQTALDGKAPTSHTHTASQITDFDTEVSNNTSVAANTAKVSNATHTGEVTGSTALTIASNVVDADNLNVVGNGTTSQYLRSDGDGSFTWATPPDTTANQTITLSGDATGSGTTSIVVTVADDSHNHIISNVDGLQTALDGKMQDGGSYGTLYLSNWFRSTGNSGWYSNNYGGGIYMQDATWVRVFGNKSFLVSGTCQATDFNTTSDISLKDNVTDIDGALDKVCNLRGVEFDWKATGVHTVGFIAQEVEAIVPELVDTNEEDGIKSVKYGNVTALLVEAVKELRLEIADLKQQLANHA